MTNQFSMACSSGSMTNMSDIPKKSKSEKEAELAADLESIWQDEAPLTAKRTDFADEVDGELGTRRGGKPAQERPTNESIDE